MNLGRFSDLTRRSPKGEARFLEREPQGGDEATHRGPNPGDLKSLDRLEKATSPRAWKLLSPPAPPRLLGEPPVSHTNLFRL